MQAAELIWDAFAGHASTAAAAAAMLSRLETSPVVAASALGRTAWNAYSFNLDYRTGAHSGMGAPQVRPLAFFCQEKAVHDVRMAIQCCHLQNWEFEP